MDMTQKELIATIAGMSNEEQKKVFEELKKNGLTEKEVQTIREMTFFYKLYNDKKFYDETVEAIGDDLYNRFTA